MISHKRLFANRLLYDFFFFRRKPSAFVFSKEEQQQPKTEKEKKTIHTSMSAPSSSSSFLNSARSKFNFHFAVGSYYSNYYKRINWTRSMFLSVVSVSACTITGLAYWRLKALQRQEAERKLKMELQFKAQAEALSKDLILGVLKTDQSLSLVSKLLLNACKHEEFKKELNSFLKYVFIENERGSRNLKNFVVDKVILDAWVKENLLSLVQGLGDEIMNDKRIWPDELLMNLLKNSALDALTGETFNEELWDAVARSLWGAFFSWNL